ncbi:MAG: nicotinate-nucleotide--dimethylbenzimidazole phosphoribosyltransferase [Pseudomonadota bacterium]|nr:nicotinate-nucleotide--dimethylbenzimidazole phosphoribosyltransferase [Pseudomonadota bacterium]
MDHDDIVRQLENMPPPDNVSAKKAVNREANLTKPAGSLGRLEELSAWCAAWQACYPPRMENTQILVFAGNHGVAVHGVSAFPPEVTHQMVANFAAGGAAINQLAHLHDADLCVVDLDLDRPTADFTSAPAMSVEDFSAAFGTGYEAVDDESDALVVGEMGIGNTTTAAALSCALYGGDPAEWTGAGTGLDAAGIARKTGVVAAAMDLHGEDFDNPLEALRRVGGREMVAMAGAVLAARHARVPVILDGFVATAAVSVLERAVPGSLDHTVAGHVSGEPGHRLLLEKLGKQPLLDLGMRLGEASGAAVALSVLRCALAAHNGMSTFEDAAVSGKDLGI